MKPTVDTVELLKFAIHNESERRGLPRRDPAEVLAWIEQDCYGWLVHEVNVAEQVETLLGIVVVPDADVRKDLTCPTQVAEARWPDKSLMVTRWTHKDLKAEDRRDAMRIEMARENPLTPFGFNPETFAPMPSPVLCTPQGDADAISSGNLAVFTYDRQQDPLGPTAGDPPVRYIVILMARLTGYFLPIYPLLIYWPGNTPLPLFFYPLPAPGIILRHTDAGHVVIDTFPGLVEQLNKELEDRRSILIGAALFNDEQAKPPVSPQSSDQSE